MAGAAETRIADQEDMIVEPDFLDHWKTRLLCDLLEDEAAPLLVIRLWAHCQSRKTGTFENMEAGTLRAICRYKGPANRLWDGLMASGFVCWEIDCGLVVHQWEETNKGLVKNWTNGCKGGRPKGNPAVSQREPLLIPAVTQEEPSGNPTLTHHEPADNPAVTDRVDRVDRSPLSPPEGGGESEADARSLGNSETAAPKKARRRGEKATSVVWALKEQAELLEKMLEDMDKRKKAGGEWTVGDRLVRRAKVERLAAIKQQMLAVQIG